MVLGVTGTIGSGKSTVCSYFKDKNIPVISADIVGHNILSEDDVKAEIRQVFGDVFTNDKIDRQKLAQEAFANKSSLNALNNITHPKIKDEIIRQRDELLKTNSLVVIEIPLLFECGFEDLVDKTLLIITSKEKTIDRLIKRGMTKRDAILRYNSQMDPMIKVKKADFCIENEGDFEKLFLKVAEILNKMLKYICQ